MLEVLIKTMMTSIIIALFLILGLRDLNESVDNAFTQELINNLKNELTNTSFQADSNGFKIVKGEGSTVVCEPRIINESVGRVCVAS